MQRHQLKRPQVWDKGYFPIIEGEDPNMQAELPTSPGIVSPQQNLTPEAKIARRPEIGSWHHLKGTLWAIMEKQDDSILVRQIISLI